jgi:anthranilate phosphoribosyltransferase
MLGPLVNPANPRYQLLGVYNLSLLRLYTYVYQSSGINFGVVHSLDGCDEISLTSDFKLTTPTKEKLYSPEDLGLPRCQESDLYGGDTPAAAARIFDAVLSGTSTQPQRNCVLANAAFSIRVLHPEKSLDTCFAEADESLKSGRALSTFKKFVEFNS